MATKFVGILPLTRAFRFDPREGMYTTLLMSTGLTFGTISALFGLTNHIIDRSQYTVLVTAVIGSAVVPTLIAQRWFQPSFRTAEDAPIARARASSGGDECFARFSSPTTVPRADSWRLPPRSISPSGSTSASPWSASRSRRAFPPASMKSPSAGGRSGRVRQGRRRGEGAGAGPGRRLRVALVVGHPVSCIAEFVQRGGYDLLVVGYMGHSALYNRVIGSTTDRLVELAPCKVLVVKSARFVLRAPSNRAEGEPGGAGAGSQLPGLPKSGH